MLGLTGLLIPLMGCGEQAVTPVESSPAADTAAADPHFLKREVTEASVQQIKGFCGDCHAMPRADHFPVENWRHEVERGFAFYDSSGRSDLVRPNLYDTVAYFAQQARPRDEFMRELQSMAATDRLEGLFERQDPPRQRSALGVGNVELAVVAGEPGLVACDMVDGTVYFHPLAQLDQVRELTTCQAPVNATPCDLDQDGIQDLLISDIGNRKAADSEVGQIIWLRGTTEGLERIVLATDLGRICQTIVNDFEGDGTPEILVAEFGYFHSGSIYRLVPGPTGFQPENFRPESLQRKTIDERHGTVRLACDDLDGDGDLDFLAAIAQEYETVVLFLNDGKGHFQPRSIFAAGYPSYGSSGLELVDFDQDGDLDVLYTNGDTFDSMLPKAYHSIQWLENDGELNFRHHSIARMPGVHAARAADFDQDGDLDIVACAYMSQMEDPIEFDSLVYLENNGQFEFTKYAMETGRLIYPNLKIADIDGDGRLDFAAGTCSFATPEPGDPPLRIYLNRGK